MNCGCTAGLHSVFRRTSTVFRRSDRPAHELLTDAFRSKWGETATVYDHWSLTVRPAVYVFVYAPRWLGFSQHKLVFWYIVCAIFLVGTYTNIPYDAVAPELTDNYEDRTNVFFFCTLFDGLGGLVAVGGPVGLTSLLSQEKSCDYSSCYNPASFVGSNQSVYGTVNTCAR